MKNLIFICIFFTIFHVVRAEDIKSYLPTEKDVGGWTIIETRICRTHNDLFNYMDGGAELYFGFNFERLAARIFKNGDGVLMTIELYQLKTDADAYGLYTILPMSESIDIGDKGGMGDGMIRFWKGNFMCSISLSRDYSRHITTIKSLGLSIAGKIKENGKPPWMINLLPLKDLKKYRLQYFHDYTAQKNIFFINTKNILQLGLDTEGIFGEYYDINADEAKIFIIKYLTEAKCENIYRDVLVKLLNINNPTVKEGFVVKELYAHDFKAVDRVGNYLILGFGTNENGLMKARMKEIERNLAAGGF